MLLLGNDIVDLTDKSTFNKHNSDRFLSRVYASPERVLIQESYTPNIILWVLWAAKETAFKIISKIESPPLFSHNKFVVSISKESNKNNQHIIDGFVNYNDYKVPYYSRIEKDFIHVVGSYNPKNFDIDNIPHFSGVYKCSKEEKRNWKEETNYPDSFSEQEKESVNHADSALVRKYCKAAISKELDVPIRSLEIIRPSIEHRTQPPYLLINKQRGIDISLSHHGNYMAWVFEKK